MQGGRGRIVSNVYGQSILVPADDNWRRPRSGTETFGLILGLLWACTGLYVLATIYKSDLFR